MNRLAPALLFALVLLAGAPPARAAGPLDIKVRRIDVTAFPLVSAVFEVLDVDGAYVRNIPGNAINAMENDEYLDHVRVETVRANTNVVFVLDNSKKMQKHFNEMKQNFYEIVQMLDPEDRAGLVFLRGKSKVMQTLSKDKFKTLEKMGQIGKTGHNDTYPGLDLAFRMLQKAEGAREIILVTAAMPEIAKLCKAQYQIFLQLTHVLRMHGVRLHIIGLGEDALDDDTMERLAAETGGVKLVSPNPYELRHVFKQVVYGVPAVYRLSYISPQSAGRGCPYTLRIVANSPLGHGEGAIRFRP